MKVLKFLSIIALSAFLVTTISCGDGEDPIVDEVEDLESPEVAITAPADGATVGSLDATMDVVIKFTATDDVELASVVIDFDGEQIDEITTFADFRNYSGEVTKEDVADGSYTITVTATDVAGKTGSATSTFEKITENPYTPLANEVLYMPFEGNFLNRVTDEEATEVGSPDFAGEGKVGNNAYKGATGAYLTLPAADIQSNEMTVSLYMKINADPDRAGILVMGPPDEVNTEFQNNRNSGFRFFREASHGGEFQRFKVNVGTGETDFWLDGGDLADVDPTVDEWHHFAFVIGATTATVYIDGVKVSENTEHTGMDLTGCDLISIMSGEPRFTEWNHSSDLSYLDDLRIFNAALTEADLETLTGLEFGDPEIPDPEDPGLEPIDGDDATEIWRMSFDTDFGIEGASVTATAVGAPSVVDGGVSGKAYSGGVDSYLTVPVEGILNDEFSASMWINMNSDATRAGILNISAVHPDDPTLNNLTKGFRFFREGDATSQVFKLNVGTGEGNQWIDGGSFARFAADREGWLHMAITIGRGKSQVYLNGILAAVSAEDVVVDWTGCEVISIGSGAPNFTEWDHLGETGLLDEVRIFSGILNPAQIAALKAEGE